MSINPNYAQQFDTEIPAPRHPATYGAVQAVEMTPWIYTDDAEQIPDRVEKSTQCQIVEEVIMDDYGGEISREPFVRHRYFDRSKKRWSNDLASSRITPDVMLYEDKQTKRIPGLKQKFGTAFAEYERRLVADGREIPIELISDVVYPQVVNMLKVNGVRTINALAELTDRKQKQIAQALEAVGRGTHAKNVAPAVEKAKERLARLGVGKPQAA